MRKNIFRGVFLAACVILALLLLSRVISVILGALIFAAVLVACGLLVSRWSGHSAHR